MADRLVDVRSAAPAPALAGLILRYDGCRLAGFPPGEHLGLPSPHLEVIFSLDEPLRHADPPRHGRPARPFDALAAGLQTGPAMIVYDGSMHTVSMAVTPSGARALLGLPAAALAGAVVSLDDLLGRYASELRERLAGAADWPTRFALLDQALLAQALRNRPGSLGRRAEIDATLAYAWQRIVADPDGAIGALAARLGYTRQHLAKRFMSEFGRTPKQVARLARFARSRRLLREAERTRRADPARPRPTLAEVAAGSGYYDQAHLAREWNALAGCPPSVWVAEEQLPFVQAGADRAREGSPV
jgi:AraC-like DNA-binding protein